MPQVYLYVSSLAGQKIVALVRMRPEVRESGLPLGQSVCPFVHMLVLMLMLSNKTVTIYLLE